MLSARALTVPQSSWLPLRSKANETSFLAYWCCAVEDAAIAAINSAGPVTCFVMFCPSILSTMTSALVSMGSPLHDSVVCQTPAALNASSANPGGLMNGTWHALQLAAVADSASNRLRFVLSVADASGSGVISAPGGGEPGSMPMTSFMTNAPRLIGLLYEPAANALRKPARVRNPGRWFASSVVAFS